MVGVEDQRIHALDAEGVPGREIARRLGVDRGRVQRLLAKRRKGSTPGAVVGQRPTADDSELTSEDVSLLDLVPADLATVLDPLARYRTQRAPAVFGERGAEALRRLQAHPCWTTGADSGVAAAPGAIPEFPNGDRMSSAVRDRRISELRCAGWTLADIGDAVGMSEGGVSRALRRLSGESNTSED
jgi:transcriptional regulator with XRE-family HTH domain